MSYIFISYSRKDTSIVDRLISKLDQAGHQVWIDREGIRGGEQWRREIVAAIKSADVFLLVLSPNSVKSDNVRKELDLAETVKKRVLPIVVQPTTIPDEMSYQIIGLQLIDLSRNFDDRFNQLLHALGRAKPQRPEVSPPMPWIQNNARGVMLAAILAIVALVIVSIAAIAVLIQSSNKTASLQGGVAVTTPPTEQSDTATPTEVNVDLTLETAIETAIAATEHAEGRIIEPSEIPTPEPSATPLPLTVTPTPQPSPTPTIPINTATSELTLPLTTELNLLVEDFEGYSSRLDDSFEINRNAGNEATVSLVGLPHVSQGRQAMAFDFDIRNSAPNHYIGFDRQLPPQDWSSFSSLCFWIESDGSNRTLVLQFGESKYKFWKTISSLSNGTGDYCVSLNDQHQINLRSIGYYGIYVEGPPAGQSIIYIDDIRLVN